MGTRVTGLMSKGAGEALRKDAGLLGEVVYAGETKAFAGGTITIGALLDVTASGTLQAATSGDAYFAQALAAAASGDIFKCIIRGAGYNRGL